MRITLIERGGGLANEGQIVESAGEAYLVGESHGPIHCSPAGSGRGDCEHVHAEHLGEYDDDEHGDRVHSSCEARLGW